MLAEFRKNRKIQALKEYFADKSKIKLAFLFGSQVKGSSRYFSDWDIAVYFNPQNYLETETEKKYQDEEKIWADMVDIVQKDVDLVVLNRARPALVFSILNSGIPLLVRDRKLFLKLLCKTSYEAIDFWNFVNDYWLIRERARSLTPEDRGVLLEKLTFLEEELKDLKKFQKMSQKEYETERDKRRNIERWTENIVMATLDIAKIILASKKEEIPQTYKDVLYQFGLKYGSEEFSKELSLFAPLRNIVVHEYLDLRWRQIQDFISRAERLSPKFIGKIKDIIKKQK